MCLTSAVSCHTCSPYTEETPQDIACSKMCEKTPQTVAILPIGRSSPPSRLLARSLALSCTAHRGRQKRFRSVFPGFRSTGTRRTWRARARCSAPAGGRPCSDVAGPPVSRRRARSSPGQGRGGERDLGLERQDSLTGAGGLFRASGWAGDGCPEVWGTEGGSVSSGGGGQSFSQK